MCNNCDCEIRTIASEVSDGNLYLLLKKRIFQNGERFGLIICNNIPRITGANDYPVRISVGIGPDAATYPLLTTDGATVFAYQLKTRCKFPVTVSTTSGAFLVNPKHLCYTSSILPVTAPAAATASTFSTSSTKKSKEAVDNA